MPSASEDGTVTICVPVDPEVKMEWVDEGFDIGNFAAGTRLRSCFNFRATRVH